MASITCSYYSTFFQFYRFIYASRQQQTMQAIFQKGKTIVLSKRKAVNVSGIEMVGSTFQIQL